MALTIAHVRSLALLFALTVLLGGPGCGREQRVALDPACREGSDEMLRALRQAPSPVSLDGTPLSSCLRDAGDGGDLRDVGSGYLDAAAALAADAEKDPGGPETVRLGYLVGAAHRGADSDGGPASELVRRIDNEAARANKGSAAFMRGERAGRRTG